MKFMSAAALAMMLFQTLGVSAAEDPIWTMKPRTPWLTPAREVMNLGGPGSEWKATFTHSVQGEFIKMAGDAKIHRWSDEPVDEAKAKWVPVKLPQKKFQSTHWKLGVGYYERTVTLTKEQAARNVRISFEQIGLHYRVWVNGQLAVDVPLGSSFLEQHDISAFVKAGENTIRISCGDKMGDDNSWIDWPLNGCRHGIVRPFYLEFRDKVAIEKVMVRTQVTPEKVMAVSVCVTNMTNASVVREVKVRVEGEQWTATSSVTLKPGEGKVVELKKPWPEARLWSPADPFLYNLIVSLDSNTPELQNSKTDSYRVRFGFREVRWIGTDHRAVLNGKPFMMLRNTTAPIAYDRDKNRTLINRLKSRGVVGYRYFTEDTDLARFCDLCDEEGFLVVTAASSGWGAGFKTEAFWPRWKRMLGKMMDQCGNSPAIICWGLSNEFGTVYGGKNNMANAVKQGEIGEWVQAQDPTRPWECYGEIELRWHGKEGPMPIRSYHYPVGVSGTVLPQGGRWYADGGRGWQGAFTNDKPVSVSEDLFHGFQDSHATTAKALVGDRVYTLDGYVDACWYTLRNYCEGYLSGGLAAWDPWCFYVEAEKNPIFDGPRGTPHTTQLIMLKEHRRNLTAGKTTPLTLVVLNGGFAAEKGVLVRKTTVGGKIAAKESVRMDLGAGEKREMKVGFTMPEVEAITPVKVTYTWTGDNGAKIAETEFDFMAVPPMTLADVEVPGKVAAIVTKTNSVLPQLKFRKGIHRRAADAIRTKPEAIVLNGPLLPQDAQMLDDWVKEGGRVLQLEPERTDWSVATLPSEEKAGWFRYSFSFRRDDKHMKDIPEEAMRLWAPDGFVGAVAFPKPKTDARVLWESVHGGGMQWAEIAWFWRGKGGWLVSCVPATERLGVEPVAPHVLASLFRELVAENVVAPQRKTVLVDFGPNPADGTNAVRHVAELFAQQGAMFEQINYGADGVRALPGTDDAVFVVDAKGTNLSAKAKAFVQKTAAKGGRVLILDMGKDEDPEWLKYLGVSWEKPLPKLMAPIPWNPSQTNEVDQSRRFFTHIGNSGAIAGINNEDLFWWKPDQMWSYYRYKLVGRYPTFLWQKMAGEPVSAYFESADKGTRILTEPGAIAMKTVKGGLFGKNGAVVVATFSLSRKDYGGDHPDKVYRTIKTLLNNMGARTSKAATPSEFEFVDLKPLANVASWRKPGAEKLAFTWSKTMVDYRFFPVNKCGWSVTAQNFCPAEEFPTVPLSYDGIYFQFINPETNGGKDLLFNRLEKDGSVVIKLPKPVKAKKLHFLGFGVWSRGADVWFGDQKAPVKIVVGDHVGNWANNWGVNTKRGKQVFSGVWDVPHAERGEKYAPGKAFVYHWSLENPEPNKPIDKITLGYGLAYFAITIEK